MITNSINSVVNALNRFENQFYRSTQNISNSFQSISYNKIGLENNEEIKSQMPLNEYNFSNQLNNVDLTKSVLNVLVAEKGYRANLKVFETFDQLSQNAIDILK